MAIDSILSHYKEKQYSASLLYGRPGTGKTAIGKFICHQLNQDGKEGVLCDTFKPCDANDDFVTLYNRVQTTESRILVLMLEEADVMMEKIHNGTVEGHKSLPVMLRNKTEWNSFLDRFDRGRYKHVILILTSNRDPEWFDSLDPSYTRQGRINLKMEIS